MGEQGSESQKSSVITADPNFGAGPVIIHGFIDGACMLDPLASAITFAIWQVPGAHYCTNADASVEKAIDRIDVSHIIRAAVTGAGHRSPRALAFACGGFEDVIESEPPSNQGATVLASDGEWLR